MRVTPDATNPPVRGGVVEIPRGVAGPQALRVLRRMEGIVIPQVEFVNADIRDVVEFLGRVARDAEQATGGARCPAINFVLNLRGRTEVSPVTFTVRQISLRNLLRVVTQLAGLEYRIEDNVVMLMPREPN